MRIRWRGLELPSRVSRDDANSTDCYGRFVIEPFEQGFGTTIGNSLRRILLSSLEGAAVSSVKIAGVSHEFCAVEGVLEDVTDIILNIKGIVLRLEGDEPKTLLVKSEKPGEVYARDIVADPAITIINPDHKIATLTAEVPFQIEMTVRKGRGYTSAPDNRTPEQEFGVIPVDSVFSPVIRVRYRTEDMRVGQLTNYDRLILEVWTRGTVLPEDAVVEAALILRKHLNAFVMYDKLGTDTAVPPPVEQIVDATGGAADEHVLKQPLSALNLSVRAANCLEQSCLQTVGELVALSVNDLLRFRSFGKTSLHEVQHALTRIGLQLRGGEELSEESEVVVEEFGVVPVAVTPDMPEVSEVPEAPAENVTPTEGGKPDVNNGSGPMEVFTMGD